MSDARAIQREAFQHFVAGRLDDAIAGYRRALGLDPQLAIAWNGLAMVLERKDDLDGAIEAKIQEYFDNAVPGLGRTISKSKCAAPDAGRQFAPQDPGFPALRPGP